MPLGPGSTLAPRWLCPLSRPPHSHHADLGGGTQGPLISLLPPCPYGLFSAEQLARSFKKYHVPLLMTPSDGPTWLSGKPKSDGAPGPHSLASLQLRARPQTRSLGSVAWTKTLC